MARPRTGKSRKGTIGPSLTFGEEDEIRVSARATDMPLAPLNPQAGQRFIDEAETIRQSRERMSGLDHEEAVVFKDGYIVAACEGNKHQVMLSSRFNDAMVGAHMEHNHPRSEAGVNGGTFSLPDVYCLMAGPERMTVTASEGVYEFHPMSNADIGGFIDALEEDKDKINKEMRKQRYYVGRCERNGFYKNVDEARRDSINRQMGAVHNAYAERAEQYGIEYSFTPSDLGREQQVARDKVDAQQKFMRGRKKVETDRYDLMSSKRKRDRALRKDGFEPTVIYDDGKEQIIGYSDGNKQVGGIYHYEKNDGLFAKFKSFFRRRNNTSSATGSTNTTTGGTTVNNRNANRNRDARTAESTVRRAKDGRPIASIPKGVNRNSYIAQMDADTQSSIRAAVRQVQADNGYRGKELDDRVEDVMSDRLWVLEDDISLEEK